MYFKINLDMKKTFTVETQSSCSFQQLACKRFVKQLIVNVFFFSILCKLTVG
jgi:hypothetical protein